MRKVTKEWGRSWLCFDSFSMFRHGPICELFQLTAQVATLSLDLWWLRGRVLTAACSSSLSNCSGRPQLTLIESRLKIPKLILFSEAAFHKRDIVPLLTSKKLAVAVMAPRAGTSTPSTSEQVFRIIWIASVFWSGERSGQFRRIQKPKLFKSSCACTTPILHSP